MGYALRIAEKIQDKEITSLEEFTKLIGQDFKGISSSLSFHCMRALDDSLTQQTASNEANKN